MSLAQLYHFLSSGNILADVRSRDGRQVSAKPGNWLGYSERAVYSLSPTGCQSLPLMPYSTRSWFSLIDSQSRSLTTLSGCCECLLTATKFHRTKAFSGLGLGCV